MAIFREKIYLIFFSKLCFSKFWYGHGIYLGCSLKAPPPPLPHTPLGCACKQKMITKNKIKRLKNFTNKERGRFRNYLSSFSTSSFSGDDDHLIVPDGVQDVQPVAVNGKLSSEGLQFGNGSRLFGLEGRKK